MTEQLFTVLDIAREIGKPKNWVHDQLKTNKSRVPTPDFTATGRGGASILLWTRKSLAHWRTYHTSGQRISGNGRYAGYSDHSATNRVGRCMVTWKLWWRTTHDGRAVWYLSTPVGWWTSPDDGRTWSNSGLMIRPGDYRYYCVNGSVSSYGTTLSVQRSAEMLKRKLEKWSELHDTGHH